MYRECLETIVLAMHEYIDQLNTSWSSPLHEAFVYLFDLCYGAG
jgi:hypothetical protein